MSQDRSHYYHLDDDEAYHSLGLRYAYELHSDAWLRVVTDWDAICEQAVFHRRGAGEGCLILPVPFVKRGAVTKIGFA